jgi:hypothetical protein
MPRIVGSGRLGGLDLTAALRTCRSGGGVAQRDGDLVGDDPQAADFVAGVGAGVRGVDVGADPAGDQDSVAFGEGLGGVLGGGAPGLGSRKVVFPSVHCPLLSRRRGVDAIRRTATACPVGV